MIGNAKAIAQWIKRHDDIAVIVHFRPDGDAYGSALALTKAIQALGKRAFPLCDDAVEPKYRFLPGWEEFCTGDNMPFSPRAALGADVSEVTRMGKSREVFSACPHQAVIDHHDTNRGFGEACYVCESAIATGELVLEIVEELGIPLSREIALGAYVAISTDSGNFCFKNTSASTYRSAAKCVDAGVDVEEVTRILYRTRTLAQTRLLGAALDHIEMYGDGRVAAVRLTPEMYEKTGATKAEAHSIVNYLNEIEGVRVGFSAEVMDGGVKFSFRASNGADVAALAQVFGGGGHIAASGANVPGVTLEEIFPKAVEEAVRCAYR